jgi:5-methylcytosine-specific restriction protein A
MRDAIVFELAVETETDEQGSAGASEPSPEYDTGRNFRSLTLEKLRNLALDRAPPSASEEERRENVQRRSEAVKEYVLRRANGICEGCGEEAPFTTSGGRLYLEAHHIRRLSDGGPDHPRWVVALCPNCHRRVHYGRDGDEYNSQLADQLGEIEDA